ncbi:MAG: hypothetical protein AB1445_00390 [Bacillota bacterium]
MGGRIVRADQFIGDQTRRFGYEYRGNRVFQLWSEKWGFEGQPPQPRHKIVALSEDEEPLWVDWERTRYTGEDAEIQYLTWFGGFEDFGYYYRPWHPVIEMLGFTHYGRVNQEGLFQLLQGLEVDDRPIQVPSYPTSNWQWEIVSQRREEFGSVTAEVTRIDLTPVEFPAWDNLKSLTYHFAIADFGDFHMIVEFIGEWTHDDDESHYLRVSLVSARR